MAACHARPASSADVHRGPNVPSLNLQGPELSADASESVRSKQLPPFPIRALSSRANSPGLQSISRSQGVSASPRIQSGRRTRSAWTASAKDNTGSVKENFGQRTGIAPVGQALSGALEALFQTYDLDGSGSIDLDEFVETQANAVIEEGEKIPTAALVAQYMEAKGGGDQLSKGGGLDFEGFAEWQLRWISDGWALNASQADVAQGCYRMGEHILSRRSNGAARVVTPRPSGRTSKCASARGHWPPEVAIAADAEAREHRTYPRRRRVRHGGGMSSIKKGFVESVREVIKKDIRAFEREAGLEEDGSDEEEREYQRQRKEASQKLAGEEAEVALIAKEDSSSARFARELLETRIAEQEALIPADLKAARDKEKSLREELRNLVMEVSHGRSGEMLLRGRVATRQDVTLMGLAADVKLQDLGKHEKSPETELRKDGEFRIYRSLPSDIGHAVGLITRHPQAADHFKVLGGHGLRRPQIEMLPFSVVGSFEAQPKSERQAVFEDSSSGARFFVPLGQLTISGKPFAGEACFSAVVVMPNFGSLSRPVIKLKRSFTDRDAVNAAISSTAAGASSAVPERRGRSMGGIQVPVQLAATVFTRLTDATGVELAFAAGHGVEVQLQSQLRGQQGMIGAPSMWHFDMQHGEWLQRSRKLSAGRELPQTEPEAECAASLKASAAQAAKKDPLKGLREKEHLTIVTKIRAEHQAFWKQRKEEGIVEDVCLCGYKAKKKIMHGLRAKRHLCSTNPPKRLFSVVEHDAEGGWLQLFAVGQPDQVSASTERAAELPEVLLSHHLESARCLLTPSPEQAKDVGVSPSAVFTQQHYEKVAKQIIPHISYIASYMVGRAKALHAQTGAELKEASVMAFQLAALEVFVNLWIRPHVSGSAPCTLLELHQALSANSWNVGVALIRVGTQQARRDEVAKIRKAVRRRNHSMWAAHDEVEAVLQTFGDRRVSDKTAAAKLVQADFLKDRAMVLHFRQLVRDKAPLGPRPTDAQVKAGLREATVFEQAAEARAKELKLEEEAYHKEASAAAAESRAAHRAVKEALQVGDPSAQLEFGRKAREKSSFANASKEKARELEAQAVAAKEEAEEERSWRRSVKRLLEDLKASGRPPESEDPETAWKEVLAESEGRQDENGQPIGLVFRFQAEPGWDAVGTAEIPQPATLRDESAEHLEDIEEFFPPIPSPPRQVLRVSSLVTGSFRCGRELMLASEVSCSSLGSVGMSWSQVQPDGSFCLFAAANVSFELWISIIGSTVEPLRFGPFLAKSVDEVTYVGLLEPEQRTRAGEWRQHVPSAAGYIWLPRLEPQLTAESERCTCAAAQLEESSEEPTAPSRSPTGRSSMLRSVS